MDDISNHDSEYGTVSYADSYLTNIKFRSNLVGIIMGFIISIFTLAVIVGISSGFIVMYRQNDIQSLKEDAINIMTISAAKLQNTITETFGASEVLTQAMISSNYNMSQSEFQNLVMRWRKRHPLITNFEYAYGTNMPIKLIDPYNAQLIGFELGNYTTAAFNSSSIIMYGPNILVEGGIAITGMDPIYYPNGSNFGVSVVLINLNDVLESVNWKDNLKGYNYIFETVRASLIFANNSPPIQDMVSINVDIMKEKWLIKVIPEGGWIARDIIWLEGICITILCILLMTLTVFIVRQIIVSIYQHGESAYLKDKLELEIRDRVKNFATTDRVIVEKFMDTSSDILDIMNIVVLKVRDGKIIDFSGNVGKFFGVDELRNMPPNKFLLNISSKKTKIIHKNGTMSDCMIHQKLHGDINIIMVKSNDIGEDTSTSKASTNKTDNSNVKNIVLDNMTNLGNDLGVNKNISSSPNPINFIANTVNNNDHNEKIYSSSNTEDDVIFETNKNIKESVTDSTINNTSNQSNSSLIKIIVNDPASDDQNNDYDIVTD